ncbi:serine hydrolase domain-containing protein [Zunongwangia endophytica]|uniref:Serine hydrolase domain-containing protein n=1 Tax=Zunongwangia endophytica TaxID=1808945 RepID=A0ABV8H9L6_9FLAO|nr:serine hydrolase domain-containing protein [Zunongwangia endophytica]MDN3595537.1 serine hydrolase domain-containing protein [Zunongwangia endophytica]
MKKIVTTLFLSLSIIIGCQENNKKKEKEDTEESTPQQFKKSDNLEELGVSSKRVEEMDSLLQAFVDEKKVNAVTGFVAQHGNVLYDKAFGYKDLENKTPASTEDYYVLFSQTKAITTVAFMTLVEKGLVKVEDPVSKYFPEISDQVVTKVNDDGTYETRPVTTPMTFAHLMSHSSGLNAGLVSEIRKSEGVNDTVPTNFGEEKSDQSPTGQRSFGGDAASRYLKDEMIELAKYPLGFNPGSEWNYHISTNMLAYMIEVISGEPLQKYVKETVLNPLGMNDTDWYYEPKALDRFVKPYTITEYGLEAGSTNFAEAAISEDQTYAEGAIGLNGPIEDYAKFCQMLLNGGTFNNHQILKPETIKKMTSTNRLPEENAGGKGFQFGLGFQLQNKDNKHVPAVSNTAYNWGGMLGTEYIIDPENDLIALFYINMFKRDNLYPQFLEKAYKIAE